MPTFPSARKVFTTLATVLVTTLLTTLVPPRLAAQSSEASVSGRVTDQQNAVIPSVEVEMKNVDTGLVQTTKTNGDGIYSFPALPPGNYIMSVRKEQFQTVSVTGIALHTQDSLSRNFVMQVGSSAVSITVSAADAMWATTDSPAVSTLVTREFVQNMPLNGRSFQDLIALTPGAVSSINGKGLFTINGQRDDANYFMVDGVSANTFSGTSTPGQSTAGTLPAQTTLGTTQALLSVDALEEFRIQTSGYSAEYGRQPGGEIQLISRAGTNEWHGTGFDYLRNTVFDANNWFSNSSSVPRQPEHQNDFGGTLGGPVRIPSVYDGKDRTFFFFSYEGLRLLLPNFLTTSVPTVAFRQAAAAEAQPFLDAFPVPNGAASADGIAAQFRAGYSNPSSLDSIGVRLDHVVGSRLRLFGRYAYTPSNSQQRIQSSGSNVDNTATISHSVTVGGTIIVTPNFVNDVRFNYSQTNSRYGQFLDSFGGATPIPLSLVNPPQYVEQNAYQGGVSVCISDSSLCNGYNFSKGITEQHQINLTDGQSWNRGRHAIKFGVDYRRLDPRFDFGAYQDFLSFGSVDELQGGVADVSVFAQLPVYPSFTNFSAYGEDHWKATPRLTFDYGLRWEFNPVPGEASGLTPLAVTQVEDLSNLQLAPQGTSPYATQYRNFAPRVGLAWNVLRSTNHAVVLRGGFGVYYDTGQAQWALQYSSARPPFGAFYFTTLSLPLDATAVAPPVLPAPVTAPYRGLFLMDPHLKLPYTEQYNLSLDVGLSTRNTVTISYVGNQGHRLLETRRYSRLPNFVLTRITRTDAESAYSALQVQDRGFVAPGLQLVASYTWAHAIDNVSTDLEQSSSLLRGNSNNDIRHVLNLALNYQVPSSARNRVLRGLTKGWLWANRFTAQSGYPFNVIQGSYVDPLRQTINLYPDLVQNVPIYLHGAASAVGGQPVPGEWRVNVDAFSPVDLNPDGTPVHQGSLPRNFLKGPTFFSLNTAVERTFPIRDRLHLIFRVEAFNVMNHPNFSGVDTNLEDPTFGQASGTQTIGVANQLYATGTPRSLQFMLKLQF